MFFSQMLPQYAEKGAVHTQVHVLCSLSTSVICTVCFSIIAKAVQSKQLECSVLFKMKRKIVQSDRKKQSAGRLQQSGQKPKDLNVHARQVAYVVLSFLHKTKSNNIRKCQCQGSNVVGCKREELLKCETSMKITLNLQCEKRYRQHKLLLGLKL